LDVLATGFKEDYALFEDPQKLLYIQDTPAICSGLKLSRQEEKLSVHGWNWIFQTVFVPD